MDQTGLQKQYQFQAQQAYQGAVAIGQAPKELGILQRIEGLSNGLNDLQARIDGVRRRIMGEPPPGLSGTTGAGGAPTPVHDIRNHLNDGENTLRACLALVDQINEML